MCALEKFLKQNFFCSKKVLENKDFAQRFHKFVKEKVETKQKTFFMQRKCDCNRLYCKENYKTFAILLEKVKF